MKDAASACIEQIKQLGFKSGTKLNMFCVSCPEGINILSDRLDKEEIGNYLDSHRAHGGCFFGFSDGRRWKIQNDGGIDSHGSQRIDPIIETLTEKPLSKSNPEVDIEKNETSLSSISHKQDAPIKKPETKSIDLSKGANPQAEDGHVDIANEIVEALAKTNLCAYESRILWALWRKTYGWHKKADMISITQFQRITKLKRQHVSRTISKLLKRNIVTRIGDSRISNYGFQKDYTKWRNVTKRGDDAGISTVSGHRKRRIVTRMGDRSSPKGVTTKETNKRKIYVEGLESLRLATLLLTEIRKNKSDFKEPNLQVWARDFDLMLTKDNRSADRIEKVIRWAQSDHGDGTGRWKGWAANILSPAKLRLKFDVLEMQMGATSGGRSKSSW